ncbi:MAG: Rod shape-determining protein rodA [candidate division NC10 bacterium CSP1-5]|nr:MAG: Rod shape-determining protein rodA [candidate division NC10 bacterium CSP1-5]
MYLDRRMLANIDWRIAGTTLALIGVGILTIWSANLGSPSPPRQTLYLRQALYAALALLGLLTATFINYRTIARFAYVIFGVVLALLILVSVAGEVGRGAQRWIQVGGWTFQPSEFMKLALIVVLARYFEDHKERLGHPRLLVIPAMVALPPMVLILKQPDLGTAVLLGLLTVSVLLLVGLRVKHLVFLTAAGATMAPLLWSFLKDYQRRRVLVFLNPELDPSGAGYHIAQSKIAVGSGEFFGKGLKAASQSQLHFLPASQTDFILAVLAEQWGFIGCLVILLLYYVLITRGLEIAGESKDIFGALLAFGIMAMITVQLVVNVGMVVGIMPVVGIPLPLLSYGGSSLVVTCIGIGLVMSVHLRRFLY